MCHEQKTVVDVHASQCQQMDVVPCRVCCGRPSCRRVVPASLSHPKPPPPTPSLKQNNHTTPRCPVHSSRHCCPPCCIWCCICCPCSSASNAAFCAAATAALRVLSRSEHALQVRLFRFRLQNSSCGLDLRQPVHVCVSAAMVVVLVSCICIFST
ncbi:hypothetical protein BAUCODRAFT_316072 [Baudoinia panamericana UAMH 10762]|uniref:Uncharacterized protein n=1 Tax=Baudoinia panamericana (strain UAMH 10762) TaxID=717646 RepID=M2MXZ2_BAUPA|nr:uncharacterized protein BAUCODRAFT_316072 [Baudoinia panamericana UAMH 10762]EMC91140.1 hypothetical protein BAUCODRAFT_316072 [Baudoinia panamericana UAMH 10762]